MASERESNMHVGFVSSREPEELASAPWGLWTFVWRPLRRRWCLVLNIAGEHGRLSWTREELQADASLAFSIRPRAIAFGSVASVMDQAREMKAPYLDVPATSPFWNGEP